MVGVARFELTTPASRRQCSTRLSYTPNRGAAYSQQSWRVQRANLSQSHISCSRCRAAHRDSTRLQLNDILPHTPVASSQPSRYLARSAENAEPVGASPSGKASVFGTDIPRFESWCPSQLFKKICMIFRRDARNLMFRADSVVPRTRTMDKLSLLGQADFTLPQSAICRRVQCYWGSCHANLG